MDSVIESGTAKLQQDHYVWQLPERSVEIYVAFAVVDEINQALAQITAAPPLHGAEIGGLFFGRREQGKTLTVWIEGFELLPCIYPRGASWQLTEEEQDEFAQTLAAKPEGQVAGFFRSHTRKGLFLSEEDVSFLSRFFAEPENVFLLVKPFTTRPNLGGFFLWENGSIHPEASRREFLFQGKQLSSNDPALVPATAPSAETLPGLVPFETAEFTERASVSGIHAPLPGRWLGAAAVLIAAGLLMGYFIVRTRALHPARVDRFDYPLKLNASESEKTVVLTWDRRSTAIVDASHAALSIREGTFHRDVELTPDQLRTGTLLYSRPIATSDTISFRFHIDTVRGEPVNDAVEFVPRETLLPHLANLRPLPPLRRETTPPAGRPVTPVARKTVPAKTIPVSLPVAATPAPPVAAEVKPDAAQPPKILRPAPRREP